MAFGGAEIPRLFCECNRGTDPRCNAAPLADAGPPHQPARVTRDGYSHHGPLGILRCAELENGMISSQEKLENQEDNLQEMLQGDQALKLLPVASLQAP